MVEVIRNFDELARLTPQWNEMLHSSGSNCPFLTMDWLGAWWAQLKGSSELHVITVRDGERLLAAAPLRVVRGPLGLFARYELLATGHAGSDYLDLIARDGHDREALDAFAAALATEKRTLRLTHLPVGSLAGRLACRLTDDGWTVRRGEGGVCPFINLAGHSWDSYLSTLGSSHRANFRRRLKGLSQRFDMRFEAVADEPARREALDALIGFHRQRFGRGSTAFVTDSLRAFHDDFTRRALEHGWLRMFTLRLNGAPAGVMYGFFYDHRFFFYQHGFDAAHEPLSPGLVLMGLTIQAAIAEGAFEFDMLYGTEKYKSLWARDQRPLAQVQLFPPSVAGFFHRRTTEAERSARTVARKILSLGGARAA